MVRTRRWSCAIALAAVASLAAPLAAGHWESEAAALRPDVVRAWHEPAVVAPHAQWSGFLQLERSSNVTQASYQVCRVGSACFAPPQLADDLGNGTFRFSTSAMMGAAQAVDFHAGWRLGVQWALNETRRDGTSAWVVLPAGQDPSGAACEQDNPACAESHYLAFDVAAAPTSIADPAPGWLWALAAVVTAAMWPARRRA